MNAGLCKKERGRVRKEIRKSGDYLCLEFYSRALIRALKKLRTA